MQFPNEIIQIFNSTPTADVASLAHPIEEVFESKPEVLNAYHAWSQANEDLISTYSNLTSFQSIQLALDNLKKKGITPSLSGQTRDIAAAVNTAATGVLMRVLQLDLPPKDLLLVLEKTPTSETYHSLAKKNICKILESPRNNDRFINHIWNPVVKALLLALADLEGGPKEVQRLLMIKDSENMIPYADRPNDVSSELLKKLEPTFVRTLLAERCQGGDNDTTLLYYLLHNLHKAAARSVLPPYITLDKEFIKNIYGVDYDPRGEHFLTRWIYEQLEGTYDFDKIIKLLVFAKANGQEEHGTWLEEFLNSDEGQQCLSTITSEQLLNFISLLPISPNNILFDRAMTKPLIALLTKATDLDQGPEVVKQILAARHDDKRTVMHSSDFILEAFPLLEALAKKKNGPALIQEMLSTDDDNGNTPLHYLFRRPEDLPDMTNLKLSPGAINALLSMTNNEGNTPLHFKIKTSSWLKSLPTPQLLRLLFLPNKQGQYVSAKHLTDTLSFAQELDATRPGFLITWLAYPDAQGITPLRNLCTSGNIPIEILETHFGISDFPLGVSASDVISLAMFFSQDPIKALQFVMALGYIAEARKYLLTHMELADQIPKEEIYTMLSDSAILHHSLPDFQRVLPLFEALCKKEGGSALARNLLMWGDPATGNPVLYMNIDPAYDEDVDLSPLLDWLQPEDARAVLEQPLTDHSSNMLLDLLAVFQRADDFPSTFITTEIIKKLYNVDFNPRNNGEEFAQKVEDLGFYEALVDWAQEEIKELGEMTEQNFSQVVDIIEFIKAAELDFITLLHTIPLAFRAKAYELAPEILRPDLLLLGMKLNPAHISAGASLKIPVPEPIETNGPDFYSFIAGCIEAADKELGLTPQTKAALLNWEEKIRNNVKFDGLDEDPDIRKKQYQDYCAYLGHVFNAYKIGQDGGDSDTKMGVLQRIVEANPLCFPRGKQEILLSYIYRPRTEAEIAIEGQQSLPTMQDRVLQRLRTIRIEILSQDMLTFGGNVHEPNYLLDLFRVELDTRLEPSGDIFAPHVAQYYQKSVDDVREEFHERYNKCMILESFFEHLRTQQSKTTASKDPLDLSPAQVQDFLAETYGPTWKQQEYDKVAKTAREMVNNRATTKEITTYLDEYGIDWLPEENIDAAVVRLNTRVNTMNRLQNPPEEFAKLQAVEKELAGKTESEQREILLKNKLIVRGQKLEEVLTEASIKQAQINKFMSTEVFEGGEEDPTNSRFTRQAALLLLKASGVLGDTEI